MNQCAIENMFDRVAPKYDVLNSVLSCNQHKRWKKSLVARLPNSATASLLDVATGTGDILFLAMERGLQGTGVDISAQMLCVAQQKAAKLGFQPSLRRMSAAQLAFDDGSFSHVSIAFGLRNVEQKQQALNEFHRVLLPGGKLLILEFFQPKGVGGQMYSLYFKKILPRIGGILSDRAAYQYLPDSVESFYSPVEMDKVAEQLGFRRTYAQGFLFGSCRLLEFTKLN